MLHRTVWGYEIRAVGANPVAAGANGIAVGRTVILAFCLAGLAAGLGGAVQLLGLYYRISTDSFVGLGFSKCPPCPPDAQRVDDFLELVAGCGESIAGRPTGRTWAACGRSSTATT